MCVKLSLVKKSAVEFRWTSCNFLFHFLFCFVFSPVYITARFHPGGKGSLSHDVSVACSAIFLWKMFGCGQQRREGGGEIPTTPTRTNHDAATPTTLSKNGVRKRLHLRMTAGYAVETSWIKLSFWPPWGVNLRNTRAILY